MTLIEQLDAAMPTWRLEYDNDPIRAGADLGLIDDEELEVAANELDFRDEAANWRRLYESAEDE